MKPPGTRKEAHSLAAGKPFFRRSVRKDVAPPPGLKPTGEITFFDYDVEKAAKEKGANLKKFDEVMCGTCLHAPCQQAPGPDPGVVVPNGIERESNRRFACGGPGRFQREPALISDL